MIDRLSVQSSLRTACGVVPQDTVLFNDSILYNIRFVPKHNLVLIQHPFSPVIWLLLHCLGLIARIIPRSAMSRVDILYVTARLLPRRYGRPSATDEEVTSRPTACHAPDHVFQIPDVVPSYGSLRSLLRMLKKI